MIPFGITMVIFVWGAQLFFGFSRPPDNAHAGLRRRQAVDVEAAAPRGPARDQRAARADRPGRCKLTHDLRGRHPQLLRPGLPHQAGRRARAATPPSWFEATKAGEYHLFCAEYCGTEHSGMIGQVVVMEPADYQSVAVRAAAGAAAAGSRCPRAAASASPVAAGEALFTAKACATCHLPQGGGLGPSLVGVFGKPVHAVGRQHGRRPTRPTCASRSSTRPAKVVQGFQPIMPTFQGQLSEEQADAAHRVHQVAQEGAPAPGRAWRRPHPPAPTALPERTRMATPASNPPRRPASRGAPAPQLPQRRLRRLARGC